MEIITSNLKQFINFKPLNWSDAMLSNPNTALILACKNGNLDKIKKSIRYGAMNTNIGLHYCVIYNFINCTKYLLSIGSNFQNKRSIYKVIESDSVLMLKTLLETNSIYKKYFSIDILVNEFYSIAYKHNAIKCIELLKNTFDFELKIVPLIQPTINNEINKSYNSTKKMLINSIIKNDINLTHLLIASGINLSDIILDETVNFEVREYLKCYW